MTSSTHGGITVDHVLTHDDYEAMLTELAANDGEKLAFDIETHTRVHRDRPGDMNLEEWHPSSKVTVLTLSPSGDRGWALPLSHTAAPWGDHWEGYLRDVALALLDFKLIAHNAKFDARWVLWHTGVDLSPALHWDTMLAAHVLDETRDTFRLKNLAADLAPDGDWGDLDLSDTEAIDWTPLARYATFDTAMTYRLYEQQYEELKGQTSLARVFGLISMPICRTLTRAEHRGIEVDPTRVEGEIKKWTSIEQYCEKYLYDLAADLGVETTGKVSLHGGANYFRELMQKAIDADLIEGIERTPGGQWSWRKGVRAQLRDKYELAEVIDGYRNSTKRLEYLRVWRDWRDDADRLHSSTRVHGTTTGRLSSANPNMQQVARDLKQVFTAREGWTFVEMDYSQIELRVAAWISGCRPMLQAFQQGRDLHTLMGSIITGKDEGEVTKEERQQAKAANFGFIYGQQAPGFVNFARENYSVELTLVESERMRSTFFSTWEGLEDWHARYEEIAYEQGYVTSPLGRRRLLPHARSRNRMKRLEAFRQAINSPVQATASDLMLLSLVRIDEEFDEADVAIIGTVHDSVLLEVRDTDILPQVADVMMYPDLQPFGVSLDVPLVVDATVGTHWADTDAIEMEYAP